MKTIKLYLVALVLIFASESCKKDVCTTCNYTIKGVNESTQEVVHNESGEYLEEIDNSSCEMSLNDYEDKKRSELQSSIDYQNSLNPRIEVGSDFLSIDTWDESYSYTISCE